MKHSSLVGLGLSGMAIVLLISISSMAGAGEVYKWKDEKGNTHFGDARHAPSSKEKIDIQASPPPPPPPPFPPVSRALQTPDKKKAVVISDSEVPSNCKALIDAVINTRPGLDRRPATNAYIDACPGIAQECREYRKRPQDNYCRWIRREEKDPIRTHTRTD
jgi:hypothetical protein